jgi:6,7-dimethyl-8-ribityllumazine synthase
MARVVMVPVVVAKTGPMVPALDMVKAPMGLDEATVRVKAVDTNRVPGMVKVPMVLVEATAATRVEALVASAVVAVVVRAEDTAVVEEAVNTPSSHAS